jgi:hypothetical protein
VVAVRRCVGPPMRLPNSFCAKSSVQTSHLPSNRIDFLDLKLDRLGAYFIGSHSDGRGATAATPLWRDDRAF